MRKTALARFERHNFSFLARFRAEAVINGGDMNVREPAGMQWRRKAHKRHRVAAAGNGKNEAARRAKALPETAKARRINRRGFNL